MGTRPLVDLTGRVALVPGGSGGIGRAVAMVLAECGADVALTYFSRRAPADEIVDIARRAGRRARADSLDATDASAVKGWVDSVQGEFGRLDILANCIGEGRHHGWRLFKDAEPGAWRRTLDLQLMQALYFARAVVNPMIGQSSGRIITLSSDSAKVGETGGALASAALGGVNAFSKSLAREIGRHGVTVNTVCPGPTDTDVIEQLRADPALGTRILEGMVRATPLKRIAQPREIAGVFAFLASDAAAFITGQAVSVSGGLTMA